MVLLFLPSRLARVKYRECSRESVSFQRDDYFCGNLSWVLQHGVKRRGRAACGRKSRDTERLSTVKGMGALNVDHLTYHGRPLLMSC